MHDLLPEIVSKGFSLVGGKCLGGKFLPSSEINCTTSINGHECTSPKEASDICITYSYRARSIVVSNTISLTQALPYVGLRNINISGSIDTNSISKIEDVGICPGPGCVYAYISS